MHWGDNSISCCWEVLKQVAVIENSRNRQAARNLSLQLPVLVLHYLRHHSWHCKPVRPRTQHGIPNYYFLSIANAPTTRSCKGLGTGSRNEPESWNSVSWVPMKNLARSLVLQSELESKWMLPTRNSPTQHDVPSLYDQRAKKNQTTQNTIKAMTNQHCGYVLVLRADAKIIISFCGNTRHTYVN